MKPLTLTPLTDAQAGDWARYQMMGNQRMSLRVTKTTDSRVTIEVEMIIAGKPLVLPAVRVEPRDLNRPRQHARKHDARLTVTPDAIEIAGRRWNARRLDASWTDEEIRYRRITWIADDAPLYGVLKMTQTADGEEVASMQLIEFGREPGTVEGSP